MAGESKRLRALEEVKKIVCEDRATQYGDPEDNFERIAGMWESYKGVEFSPYDVAAMMAPLKIARLATSDKIDNWLDLAGYAICGAGLYEE